VLAAILPSNLKAVTHLPIGVIGQNNAAWRTKAFETRRNVDAVAQLVIAIGHHVTNVDANAVLYASIRDDAKNSLGHTILHGNRTTHRLYRTLKFKQEAIIGCIGDPALVFDKQRFN
jgi:hypothetical protein